MSLNTQQIEHLAHLARLELTSAEKKKFTSQLGEILDYFKKLQKLDTTDIQPTSQSIELKNIFRADEIKDCDQDIQQGILDNAPDKSGRMIKVKKIL